MPEGAIPAKFGTDRNHHFAAHGSLGVGLGGGNSTRMIAFQARVEFREAQCRRVAMTWRFNIDGVKAAWIAKPTIKRRFSHVIRHGLHLIGKRARSHLRGLSDA